MITKKISAYFILLVCCLPLLFFNLKNSHDWGGDFAMYIMQAQNITEGKSMSDTGYLYLTNNAVLGPPAYLSGFPILLAPIYYFLGNNLIAFLSLINLFLIGVALFSFHFLKRHFSSIAAFVLVIIFIYNPWVLGFKSEVMSEIPFTFFLLLSVFFFEKIKNSENFLPKIFLGLLIGFLMSLRPNGLVFAIAVSIYFSYIFIVDFFTGNKKNASKSLIINSIIAFIALSFFLILNKVVFDIPKGAVSSYNHIFDFAQLSAIVKSNLDYYFKIGQSFFIYHNSDWAFLSTFLQAFFLTFVVLGFIKKAIHKFEFFDLLFLLLFALLLVYPYQKGGLRFLFPLLPFLFFYFGFWIKKSFQFSSDKLSTSFILIAATLVLFQYKTAFSEIWEERNIVTWGPQHPHSQEAFKFIAEKLPENAIIEFEKPRVLSLYSGKKALHANTSLDKQIIISDWQKNKVSHLLQIVKSEHLQSEINQIDLIVNNFQEELDLQWQNESFKLYSLQRFLNKDVEVLLGIENNTIISSKYFDFENTETTSILKNAVLSSQVSMSGNNSAVVKSQQEFGLEYSFENEKTTNVSAVKVNAFAFMEKRKDCFLVLELNTAAGENIFYQSYKLTDFINKNKEWESFQILFKIPEIYQPKRLSAKCYFWNKKGGFFYIDDLTIEVFK